MEEKIIIFNNEQKEVLDNLNFGCNRLTGEEWDLVAKTLRIGHSTNERQLHIIKNSVNSYYKTKFEEALSREEKVQLRDNLNGIHSVIDEILMAKVGVI